MKAWGMDGRGKMRAGVSGYAQQEGLGHNEAKCTLQCAPFAGLTVHSMHHALGAVHGAFLFVNITARAHQIM